MATVHYSTLAAADLYENAEYISRDKTLVSFSASAHFTEVRYDPRLDLFSVR